MLQLGRRFRATPHRNGTASSSGSYVRQLGRPFMVIAGDGLARVTDLGFQHRGRARATEDKGNRSCIGDRVWILRDGPASRGASASKASKPDTEYHGVRDGVARSRHYCASRRKPWHGPVVLREAPKASTPCNSVPYFVSGLLTLHSTRQASGLTKRQMRLPWEDARPEWPKSAVFAGRLDTLSLADRVRASAIATMAPPLPA